MNKIMLIGNLGRDPEMNYTPNGVAVCKFSLATTRYTKQNGERVQETEWFNIVAWNKTAETLASFLKKGQKVYIEGRVQSRKYTDKNGVERTAFEVVVNEFEFLTPRDAREEKNEEEESLSTEEDSPF